MKSPFKKERKASKNLSFICFKPERTIKYITPDAVL